MTSGKPEILPKGFILATFTGRLSLFLEVR